MQLLLVGDLHYDLKQLDWVLAEAPSVDLLVVAGDLLDISSSVPLDAQIAVVLEYLARYADVAPTVVCSGNHDLDRRTEDGEKETGWIAEAAALGATVDGASATIDEWLVTACAWWEGPSTLARVEAGLADAAQRRTGRWIWVWHGPPDGPLSWTGRRNYGDPELPRLIARHRPDVVLCGHVHEAPFVDGGAWVEQVDGAWVFNAGRQRGAVPAHVRVDLDNLAASWWSIEGPVEISLAPTA